MSRRACGWMVAALLASSAAGQVGGVAYEGDDRTTVRLAPGLAHAVEDYANLGYALRRGPAAGEVTVEVSLAPLASRAPLVAPAGPADGVASGAGGSQAPAAAPANAPDDDVERAARAAVAGATTVHQAVTGVLGWMVHHVAGEEGPAGAVAATGEDGASRGPAVAHPGEVARQAVAMLAAVGVEARVVHGLVVGPPRPGAPRGRHVWIEVRYPDRGWAFSDPLHHHHYVPATYVRLRGAHADETEAAGAAGGAAAPDRDAVLIERRDRRVPADVYPAGGPGVGARRNATEQVAAALRVVVPGAAEGAAVLTAADGTRHRKALLDGEGFFVGLPGGSYTLEVLVPGRAGLSRRLELAPRERSAVYFGSEAASLGGQPAARPGSTEERRPSPPPAGREPGHGRRRAPR